MTSSPGPEHNPDASLVVSVGDVEGRVAERRLVRGTTVLDAVAISSAAVPEGGAIDVDLVVEASLDGLAVVGQVTAPWQGECRRCLEPIEGEIEVDVHEIWQRHPEDPEEIWTIVGDQIDLGELVREAVLLSLPLAPLCGSGCRGPDPESFPTDGAHLADEEEGAETGGIDPRWAALSDLTFDD
ncbi:MAG: DUF177 domain-containing protein [Actinomycetia bacterium]|nr:DUF177 domain-containing protein [Actinomycetes bacterium]MCP3913773.1 DUF177 domain-containing protein [Actinomycetes bacterium]MCP4087830.1 DUF177 domain-containing protein [Actinomycetes bacterium]